MPSSETAQAKENVVQQ